MNFIPDATDFGFFQGFENPAWLSGESSLGQSTDWNDGNSLISRVTSYGPVLPNGGSAFGLINSTGLPVVQTGAFSRLGGYNAIPIHLGQGLLPALMFISTHLIRLLQQILMDGICRVLSMTVGNHLRDFIFHATAAPGGPILLCADNNTNAPIRYSPGFVLTLNHASISAPGWYTLRWTFRNNGSGALAVDCQLLNTGGTVLWTETRSLQET